MSLVLTLGMVDQASRRGVVALHPAVNDCPRLAGFRRVPVVVRGVGDERAALEVTQRLLEAVQVVWVRAAQMAYAMRICFSSSCLPSHAGRVSRA